MPTSRAGVGKGTLHRWHQGGSQRLERLLTPRFAVEAHLANLFKAKGEEVPEEKEKPPPQDEAPSSESVDPVPLSTSLCQEEREVLVQQNAARHDWIEHLGAQQRNISSRGYQRMADLRVSTTDPDATLMETKMARLWATAPIMWSMAAKHAS